MEGQIDLELLGIAGESPNETEQPQSVEESTQAEHASVEEVVSSEPAEAQPEEEELDGPEDYSPRERTLLRRIEELTQTNIENRPTIQDDSSPPAPAAPIEHNFLEGMDIDDVLSDPATFNKLLMNVYNRGLAEAGKLAAENIMRSLPQTVSRYVNNYVTMTEAVRDFYDRNPDLRSVRKTVAAVANDIHSTNPGLSTGELFEQAAHRTRELLQLKKLAPSATNQRRPAFARQKGRHVAPEMTGLQREIDDLISSRG
jgi:hypothetical protein